MKLFSIFATLVITAFTVGAAAHDGYEFATDFKLRSARVNGKIATFRIVHPEADRPEFKFVANPICAQSWPLQCGGTLIRLDDSGVYTDRFEVTVFKVDLEKIFGASNKAYITVTAPNREVRLFYSGSNAPDDVL